VDVPHARYDLASVHQTCAPSLIQSSTGLHRSFRVAHQVEGPVKGLGVGEDVGEHEVEQGVQLVQVVLNGRACRLGGKGGAGETLHM